MRDYTAAAFFVIIDRGVTRFRASQRLYKSVLLFFFRQLRVNSRKQRALHVFLKCKKIFCSCSFIFSPFADPYIGISRLCLTPFRSVRLFPQNDDFLAAYIFKRADGIAGFIRFL